MFITLTSIVYVVDLLLFVLVFLLIRSRRIRGQALVTVVLLAALAYLGSIVLLVLISSHFSS
ncbi:MAG: hypothetical protein E6H04_10740 [Bacillati bacterium ANGP1]|uniref:Uncharacterized protein n=1 Tax=Candidatus Segetimicrobium genomatis TaxID=2569760 RepID=A0A537J768_9BACT|nr:MAG: hypothetical protein E6H04_10740 [Terrabacteria group bacterium ANGP1]